MLTTLGFCLASAAVMAVEWSPGHRARRTTVAQSIYSEAAVRCVGRALLGAPCLWPLARSHALDAIRAHAGALHSVSDLDRVARPS